MYSYVWACSVGLVVCSAAVKVGWSRKAGVREYVYCGMSRQSITRYQSTALTNRRSSNIDRILSGSVPVNNGMLSYKDHGMLLCEVHILRQSAQRVMPGNVFTELLEEINELTDLRTGVERQIRVVDRIRWAYSAWIR